MQIGIVGAGVLGRLLAWQLARSGHAVTVFDPATDAQQPATGTLEARSPYAAGFTAAGMLSPIAELDNAGPAMAQLGWRSLALWRAVADQLREQGCDTPLFAQHGSLLLAHGADRGAAQRVLARLDAATAQATGLPLPQALDRQALARLEPAVAPGLQAWLLPDEGQVMPRELLQALAAYAPGVRWCWGKRAERVETGLVVLADGEALRFDWAVDVRGVGFQPCGSAIQQGPVQDRRALPFAIEEQLLHSANGMRGVRGVRGEVIWLHAPGVQLQRPLRLLHPRHRVYIVPRPGDLFVVGASEIESEDRSPVSLRTAVELMAAAQSAVPELAEARIVHMETNLRPALPDNEPRIECVEGLLRINGLFRHGWLIAPALVQDALATWEPISVPLCGLSRGMPQDKRGPWQEDAVAFSAAGLATTHASIQPC